MNNLDEAKKKEIRDKLHELLNDPIWNTTEPDKTETEDSKKEDEEFGKFGALMFGLWTLIWLTAMTSYSFDFRNLPLNGWEFWISLFLVKPFASLIWDCIKAFKQRNS